MLSCGVWKITWDQSKEEGMQAWCSNLPRLLSGIGLMLIRFRIWIELLKVGWQRTNQVHLCWFPGYREHFGNGKADVKARKDREFIGPKTSCGIYKGLARTRGYKLTHLTMSQLCRTSWKNANPRCSNGAHGQTCFVGEISKFGKLKAGPQDMGC